MMDFDAFEAGRLTYPIGSMLRVLGDIVAHTNILYGAFIVGVDGPPRYIIRREGFDEAEFFFDEAEFFYRGRSDRPVRFHFLNPRISQVYLQRVEGFANGIRPSWWHNDFIARCARCFEHEDCLESIDLAIECFRHRPR